MTIARALTLEQKKRINRKEKTKKTYSEAFSRNGTIHNNIFYFLKYNSGN